ncbi:pantoate--beta-alanine ligase, partial [Planctomycetota bacterium]
TWLFDRINTESISVDFVRDLNVATKIVPCPIVREPDGLAMSSRNRYLSDQERKRALSLFAALDLAKNEFDQGTRDSISIETIVRERLRIDVDSVDYATVVDANTLIPFVDNNIDSPAVVLIAAHVGSTRLIDNRRLT